MDSPTAIAPEADPAVRAFGRLAEKVELLETAIAGLVARRDAAPDYNQTLGEQAARLDKMVEGINILARRPAMQITPSAMAAEIEAAGAKARGEDQTMIVAARRNLEEASRTLNGYIASARRGEVQDRWIAWTAISGTALGMLLWAGLAGAIARAAPESWLLPERMAARTLRLDGWSASRRLAAVSQPKTWSAMVAGGRIVQDNSAAIELCQKAAVEAQGDVPCKIRIGQRSVKKDNAK